MRILIAEDDAIIADGLSRSLTPGRLCRRLGAQWTGSRYRLLTVTYDLLILDLGLPKLSGLEVLKRLRARNSSCPY
jgi:two-component system OmpR family response regulator